MPTFLSPTNTQNLNSSLQVLDTLGSRNSFLGFCSLVYPDRCAKSTYDDCTSLTIFAILMGGLTRCIHILSHKEADCICILDCSPPPSLTPLIPTAIRSVRVRTMILKPFLPETPSPFPYLFAWSCSSVGVRNIVFTPWTYRATRFRTLQAPYRLTIIPLPISTCHLSLSHLPCPCPPTRETLKP